MSTAEELFDKGEQLWTKSDSLEGAEKEKTLLKASAYLRKAIESDSSHGEAHAVLSRVLLELKEFEESRKEAEFAVELCPDSFRAWFSYYIAFVRFWAELKDSQALGAGTRSLFIGQKLGKAVEKIVAIFLQYVGSEEAEVDKACGRADSVLWIADMELRMRESRSKHLYAAVIDGLTELSESVGDNDELDDRIILAQGVISTKRLY